MCKRVCIDFRMKEYNFAQLTPNLLVRNTLFYHKTHLGWNLKKDRIYLTLVHEVEFAKSLCK